MSDGKKETRSEGDDERMNIFWKSGRLWRRRGEEAGGGGNMCEESWKM